MKMLSNLFSMKSAKCAGLAVLRRGLCLWRTGIFLVAASGALTAATPPQRPEMPAREAVRAKADSAKEKWAGAERPAPTEAQKVNLTKLQTDLAAIKAGSQVTTAQKQALAASLAACADGATKPSKSAVEALAASLAAALADKAISPAEKARIASAVQAVLVSANVPKAEATAVLTNAQAVLTSAGLSRETVAVVAKDLQAIAAELKANAPAKPATGG